MPTIEVVSRSVHEAVRTALRKGAARRRSRSALCEEVRRLAADEDDRLEMRMIREQLAEHGNADSAKAL